MKHKYAITLRRIFYTEILQVGKTHCQGRQEHPVCLVNIMVHDDQEPGPRFNIKMSSYQYRKSHCGDKTVIRSSYLHNGISYTGKVASLY